MRRLLGVQSTRSRSPAASPLRKERSPLRHRKSGADQHRGVELHRSERSGLHCGGDGEICCGGRSAGLHRSERSGLHCGKETTFFTLAPKRLHRSERSGLHCGCIWRYACRAQALLHRSERSGLHCGQPRRRDPRQQPVFTAPKGAVSIAACPSSAYPASAIRNFTAPKGAVSIAAACSPPTRQPPGQTFTAPKGAVSIAARPRIRPM